MSGPGVYANFEALEGTSTGASQTLNFAHTSRKIVITNDHPTNDLSYKFNTSEGFGTLKGTESLSVHLTTKKVIIQGDSVPYRIWVFG